MTHTEDSLLDTIRTLRARRGDSASVEVKRALGGLPTDMARSVCAFANMPSGGLIILGVDEQSNFSVTGVTDPATLEASLITQARNTVAPCPHIDASVVTVEGKLLVTARVVPLPLRERPATVHGVAYLRQSDGNHPMQPWELRLLESQQALDWDAMRFDAAPVPRTNEDDLDADLVTSFLASTRRSSARLRDHDDATILRRLGVVTPHGELSLAGLYALGDYPQGPLPALTVTAAVRLPGSGAARTRELAHFDGPVPSLLDDILDWSESAIPSVQAYRDDGHMTNVAEIPLSVVRELVANALVHRDLTPHTLAVGKSVQIRLLPTSFMVLSPGGLHGVSVEQLASPAHAQAAVNQTLYHIVRHVETADGNRIIEGEGGGLRHVFDTLTRSKLRPPTLVNSGVEFKALVCRPEEGQLTRPTTVPPLGDSAGNARRRATRERTINANARTSRRRSDAARPTGTRHEPAVIAALGQGPLRFADIVAQSGLSGGQVRYVLNHAIPEGRILMQGRQGARNTHYELPPAAGDPQSETDAEPDRESQ